MKTTVETIITEIENRMNDSFEKNGMDRTFKFDWSKSAHRFKLQCKINAKLEKLSMIEEIIDAKVHPDRVW